MHLGQRPSNLWGARLQPIKLLGKSGTASTARRTNNVRGVSCPLYRTPICLSFWITLLKSRLSHISSYAVQALTQSEIVILPRKKLLCWKSIGSLTEENWVVSRLCIFSYKFQPLIWNQNLVLPVYTLYLMFYLLTF